METLFPGLRCLDRSVSPARIVTFAGWLGSWALVILEGGSVRRVPVSTLEPLA